MNIEEFHSVIGDEIAARKELEQRLSVCEESLTLRQDQLSEIRAMLNLDRFAGHDVVLRRLYDIGKCVNILAVPRSHRLNVYRDEITIVIGCIDCFARLFRAVIEGCFDTAKDEQVRIEREAARLPF